MLIYSETILFPVSIYLFKISNEITRKWCEICPKLTEKGNRMTSIDINIQLIDVALVSFFLTLNRFCFLFYFFSCSYVNYTLFFISNTFISNTRLKLAKNPADAKQNPEAELLVLENYSHSTFTL